VASSDRTGAEPPGVPGRPGAGRGGEPDGSTPGASRAARALAGAVAGFSGIAVSLLVTSLLHARANPVQTVAELVIAKTPGSVAERLIHLVGRNDKPLLVAGVTMAIVVLGAVAGLVSGRTRLLGYLVFVAMAAVALVAAMTRPDFAPLTLLPLAVGTGAWLIAFAFLLDAVPVTGPVAGPVAGRAGPAGRAGTRSGGRAGTDRRTFLVRTGVVAGASVVAAVGGSLLGRTRRAVETSRRLLRLPVTAGSVPKGADLALAGAAPWRSGNAGFYRIDTALIVPAVDPNDWQLRIHGMVDREIRVSYRDLVARKLTEDWVTICCVSNPVGGPLIGNAWWSGVRVADLLAEAGVHADADAVRQTSKDGWTCGTPIQALTDSRNAMLAIAMNGEPLPLEHGFPVRMIVPGLYGYVSATKWVVDLEVTRFEKFSAFWTERGWSVKGPVKTESRIEVPRSGDQVRSGTVRVGGHAWAQHTGIAAVEVRLDGEPWQPAELGRVPGVDTWVQWVAAVPVAKGNHTLAVRATDRSGYTQTAVRADVVPNGASGWHTIGFDAA
jgi:DMSO/TMAO reductase YedYZ molybdopterin-dependent catalytic subunit